MSEAASLRICDVDWHFKSVRIIGKGNKERRCPLWGETIKKLRALAADRPAEAQMFLNHRGEPLTRYGIHTLVERYAARVATTAPSLRGNRVSPHVLRHYVASRTISGKFGFGPFFGRISRFTGYIVLPPSTPPAWGHEP